MKKPRLSARKVLKWASAFLIIAYALFLGAYFLLMAGSVDPAEDITWGVTFSHRQAEDLGLDWRQTYTALLDDIGVRHVRIPLYWDELEKENNRFDFSVWDEQLEELQKRDGKAILAIGYKLPRWPECRTPEWIATNDPRDARFSAELFQMLRVAVDHYKDNPTVTAWQVENEPLLEFGICPEADPSLLDAEIALVREVDPSRPIIITDTGELSLWINAGKRADIVGSTLYRTIHDPTLGFVTYSFITPTQYARKAQLLSWWQPDAKVIITELQAEPWVKHLPISSRSWEEQERTMNPRQFRENINYARRTGFDTFYLWGGEYWYWAKQEGRDGIWEEAKKLFANPNETL